MTQRRRAQTLNVFVQALEGTRVVVELRQDTIVRGLLQEVLRKALPHCSVTITLSVLQEQESCSCRRSSTGGECVAETVRSVAPSPETAGKVHEQRGRWTGR